MYILLFVIVVLTFWRFCRVCWLVYGQTDRLYNSVRTWSYTLSVITVTITITILLVDKTNCWYIHVEYVLTYVSSDHTSYIKYIFICDCLLFSDFEIFYIIFWVFFCIIYQFHHAEGFSCLSNRGLSKANLEPARELRCGICHKLITACVGEAVATVIWIGKSTLVCYGRVSLARDRLWKVLMPSWYQFPVLVIQRWVESQQILSIIGGKSFFLKRLISKGSMGYYRLILPGKLTPSPQPTHLSPSPYPDPHISSFIAS